MASRLRADWHSSQALRRRPRSCLKAWVVYGTSSWTGCFSRPEVSQKYECIPAKFVIVQNQSDWGGISIRSPEASGKISQVVLSVAFGVGDPIKKAGAGFPGDFALWV